MDARAPASEIAELLERKERVVRTLDFDRLKPDDTGVRAQAEEIAKLEEQSLEALRGRRDSAASELSKLSSAKTVRAGYLRRESGARAPKFFDRAG